MIRAGGTKMWLDALCSLQYYMLLIRGTLYHATHKLNMYDRIHTCTAYLMSVVILLCFLW